MSNQPNQKFHKFNRDFFNSTEDFTVIGSGELGGKASGLAFVKDIIQSKFEAVDEIQVNIPRLTVITTDYFDRFMTQNNLYEVAYSDLPDYIIAHKFQQADLPVTMIGDLRALVETVHSPLAVRSSSLLEDAMYEPFAGIYETKMIPNNQPSADERFHKLNEAIKFVYASTFFKQAKDYLNATNHHIEEEKMAIIIQEVVGLRHGDRFYPNVSGVARSYNFYPTGKASPEDGVVNLALGLGKTIVDSGVCWFYSPAYPKVPPPYGSPRDLLKQTQTTFWAVNMGKPPAFDPTKETEYLVHANLQDAEYDGTLNWIASTYDAQSDRINMGAHGRGPKVLNFAPMLALRRIELNALLKSILSECKDAVGTDVEIEFAMTFDPRGKSPTRFGFLQVRPMVVSDQTVDIHDADLAEDKLLTASENVLGNGVLEDISHIIYVKPDKFDPKYTQVISSEIGRINEKLVNQNKKYLLIGFGRWGSSDPWLGIPVNWSQINGANVIVEATLPQMNPDLSQGSHFFHNITSFQVLYLSVKHSGKHRIDWNWLENQQIIEETAFVRHVKLESTLTVKVDGRNGIGVILK